MREDGTDPSGWLAEEGPNVLGSVQLSDSMKFLLSLQAALQGVPSCPDHSLSVRLPLLCWPSPGA